MSTPRVSLSRRRLVQILGLPESAPDDEIRRSAERLLGVLRQRQRQAARSASGDGVDPAERLEDDSDEDRALADEIGELTASVERWAGAHVPVSARAARVDRMSLAGSMLGAGLMLALLVAYAGGMRVVWQQGGGFAATLIEPAELILVGSLPGATLRVLDADRDELFVKTAAEGARVELAPGRYALEVSREDCPDAWMRSVYFESGASHRFEPFLCRGEGQITIRSNVKDDRLMIDGFDVGGTGAKAHTVSVGDHDVRVEKSGYQTYAARIRITPDADLQLRAELAPDEKKGHGLRRDFPRDLAPPALTSGSLPKPEPFDLGNLRESIAPPKPTQARTHLLQRKGSPGLPDGGSTAWHDRISRELLSRFDSDGSGLIDRLEESESISCPLWQEIERDFEAGGLGLSMARYFGFDGTEWHPKALGFARNMRSAAFAKMKECGLEGSATGIKG